MGVGAEFTVYDILLTSVTYFRYLGRVLSENNNYWLEVVLNLRNSRCKWARLTRVLSREGADTRTLGQIQLAVLQLVLLYRSKTWVMTPHIRRVLGGFHHRVSHRLTGSQPWRGRYGVWI